MAPNKTQRWENLAYDTLLWIFTLLTDIFFREIHPRSTWRIPRKGPIIFVAAPHANQFVDPLILMRVVRYDAHRRISFLIAEKSMNRPFVGWAAGLMGSVPVGRAQDNKKAAKGKVYLPDAEGDGNILKGRGTSFTSGEFMAGGMIVLPSVNNESASAEIGEIVSDGEIRLKKPFKGNTAKRQLTAEDGTSFSVAPHIDQSAVYNAVFKRISEGGCIGIFPEGGSHDRTELLPLKAGLAIMALGALAEDPDCGVCIVPVGMNYFHAHKFRSRCVVEFGSPITIDPGLVEQYKTDKRREAVTHVLKGVQDALNSVTMQAPDYDTLFLIQAVRRLYNPKGKRLPLPVIIELQRRFLKGYELYKDDPRIVKLKKDVLTWHKELRQLNIRDHQLAYARLPWYKVLFPFVYRLAKLAVLSIAVIPGFILFAPVFIAGKTISYRKAKEALAASTVKVKARDVVATWKVLVSLALGPALDLIYTCIGTYWTWANRVGGRVPDWIPLWLVFCSLFMLFPAICYAALRFGEIGMDIFKSLRPLLLCLNPTSSNTLVQLRKRRTELQESITQIVNEIGPELFPDFEHQRIIADPLSSKQDEEESRDARAEDQADQVRDRQHLQPNPASDHSREAITADHIAMGDSYEHIGQVGIFASGPNSPTRSRSRPSSSDGHKLKPLTSVTDQSKSDKPLADLEVVSKTLQAAVRDRGRRRQSAEEDGWVVTEHDANTQPEAKKNM